MRYNVKIRKKFYLYIIKFHFIVGNLIVRAEIEHYVKKIEQSLELLRRSL